MPRCLYNNTISDFLATDAKSLLGSFGINYHGDILTTSNEAWVGEIDIMQDVLHSWKDEPGQIIFEYDIPRLGKRIDVVLLLRGIIFCLEFKVRQKDALQADIEQVSVYDDSIYNPLITDVLAHAGATEPDNALNADRIISPYSPLL